MTDNWYPEETYDVDEEELAGCGVFCVSVFLVDKAYGGPEEGGWYYGVGEPVLAPNLPCPRFTIDQEEARKWQIEMQLELNKNFNQYRRPIDSVLSEGRYDAVVTEGMPQAYPAFTPHYE